MSKTLRLMDDVSEVLEDVKELSRMIMDRALIEDIESKAFELGHHPLVLNPPKRQV